MELVGIYLNFDELLDPIHDEKMLVASFRRFSDITFVLLPQKSSFSRDFNECLACGLVVLQVPQHHAWGIDQLFSRLVVFLAIAASRVSRDAILIWRIGSAIKCSSIVPCQQVLQRT